MEKWKNVPLGELTIGDITEILCAAYEKAIQIAKTKKTMEEINHEIDEEIQRIQEIVDRIEEASGEIILFPVTKN